MGTNSAVVASHGRRYRSAVKKETPEKPKRPRKPERGIDLSELKPEDFDPILETTMGRELRGAVKPRKAK